MRHIDVLTSLIDLPRKRVLDIGAGDGSYSRDLEAAGAVVSAIEVDPEKVARARASLSPRADVRLGRAEALPFADRSHDLACLFFSLHHVPMEVQDTALAEVRRILRPGGRLHVVEPYPHGTMFDVVRMVEDETVVRTHSHHLLDQLGARAGFQKIAQRDYVLSRDFPTFDDLLNKIVRPDPARTAAFETVAPEMEATYRRVAEDRGGQCLLHQPCAAYHFSVED
ncbi:class I SAM-dependent methyltransferase [Fluviibacterium sp. DFM31]|uniref:Class I SAM-dependent methyltransferase n=1 Tax=Meridianimarinicoccus marinus TaxID=3231483 RepID=A0ABV3L8N5_9RHOB